MKKARILLCLLLAVVFVTALLPVTAYADATFEAGLNYGATVLWAAPSGQTIEDWDAFTTPVPGMSCVVSAYDISIYGTPTTPGTYSWSTEVECTNSGGTVTFTVVVTGHTWGDWQTGVDNFGTYHQPPTCTEGGEEYRVCSGCGEMETRDAAALGHAWDDGTVTKDPTCTEAGSADYKCIRCGLMETRAVPALGHDWEERETTQPQGMYDGKTVSVCRRCGETKEEAIPVIPADFFASLRDIHLTGGSSDLRITQDPKGGAITRGGGDSLTLTVEVTGGVEPYTYEWHCESFDAGEQSPILTAASLGAGAELLGTWQGAASSWYGAHAATYKDLFNSGWLSAVTEAAGGTSGSLLGDLNLFDKNLGSTEGPEYTAREGNCDYWVVVTDDEGNKAISDAARVFYKLRIAEQPENVNMHGMDTVWLSCKAADGSGQYQYLWYYDDNFDTPAYLHDECEVAEVGTYICRVTDQVTGDTVDSEPIQVYDVEPFRIYSSPPNATLWPEEEWELSAAVEGGVPPYEVWWDCNGVPLLTEESGQDSQGRTVYRADGKATGRYTLHAADSAGGTDTRTTYRYDKKLSISRQPEGGTLPENGSPLQMSIEVSDGKAPYTLILYHDGRRQRTRKADVGSYSFDIWDTGNYYISVRDADGHTARSDTVLVEHPKLRIASQTLGADYYGDAFSLSVVVEGGVEPYHYQWMVDTGKGWYTTGEDSNMLPVNTVGEYVCKVTDDAGQVVRSKPIPVEYKGAAPRIIEQPKSGTMEEGLSHQFACEALCGSGDENIRYDWYHYKEIGGGKWGDVQIAYDTQYLNVSSPGWYFCRVTDLVTGQHTDSKNVKLREPLNIESAELYWKYKDGIEGLYELKIVGGRDPYRIESYLWTPAWDAGILMHSWESIYTREYDLLPLWQEVAYFKDGLQHHETVHATYYFVVTDADGLTCASDYVTW